MLALNLKDIQKYNTDYFVKIHDKIRDELIEKNQKIFEEKFLTSLKADEDRNFFIRLKGEIGEFVKEEKFLSNYLLMDSHCIKMNNYAELFALKSINSDLIGNCADHARYLCEVLFKKLNLKSAMVLGMPDHVFNLIEYKGEMYVLDSWGGQIISKLDESFIKNGDLYGLFNLKIKDSYYCTPAIKNRIDNSIKKFNELVVQNIDIVSKRVAEKHKEIEGQKDSNLLYPVKIRKFQDLEKYHNEYLDRAKELKKQNNEGNSIAAPSINLTIASQAVSSNASNDRNKTTEKPNDPFAGVDKKKIFAALFGGKTTTNVTIDQKKTEQLQPTSAKNPNQ